MTYHEAWGKGLKPAPQPGTLEVPMHSDLEVQDAIAVWMAFRNPNRVNLVFTPPTRRERIRRRIRRARNAPRRYRERLGIAAHALRGDLDGWTPDE
ncbi:hypothetical protein CH263_13405 [Rhodococcus sp. 06-1059B-a]|nr:hypothetical protein [Rhodococcus sp. 06-1059B-a]OZD65135.1 hypothetical protein CH263_13405 [Rhodococcus sp. 06-1059B-a]